MLDTVLFLKYSMEQFLRQGNAQHSDFSISGNMLYDCVIIHMFTNPTVIKHFHRKQRSHCFVFYQLYNFISLAIPFECDI